MPTTPRRLVFTFCLILSSALLCRAQEKPTSEAPAPPNPDAPVTSASGTAGKIPKFTTASNIEDSIMTENKGKIGVNVAPPAATLHVNGLQPGPLATNGTNAPPLLQTTGGKGGNTTAAGKIGGKGAGISLVAGAGGNAPAGGTNGSGGNITLEPGAVGTGGTGGAAGNVLLAPTAGNVGIGLGAGAPTDKLTVRVTGDGTAVSGDADSGIGLYGSAGAGGIAVFGFDESHSGAIAVKGSSTDGMAVVGDSFHGTGVFGDSSDGLGVHGKSSSNNGVRGESTSGDGVSGKSSSNDGVYGESSTGNGVSAKATGSGTGLSAIAGTGKGIYGQSTSNSGVFGFSGSGDGVTGQSSSGYAGNFLGKAKVTGNLEIGGNESFGATARQMINLYNLDYGIGIQTNTLYFRSYNDFNWFKGGVHNNTQHSPGTGGTRLMNLKYTGDLYVKGGVYAASFVNNSDRNLKANFASVSPRAVLDKLAALPVQTWSYKGEAQTVRHMGPMAQDFRAAFDLGVDDKGISTIDSAGVTMAAVQGLYQLSQEKDRQIEQLTQEAKTLRSELDDLRARMLQLEEAMKRQQK